MDSSTDTAKVKVSSEESGTSSTNINKRDISTGDQGLQNEDDSEIKEKCEYCGSSEIKLFR